MSIQKHNSCGLTKEIKGKAVLTSSQTCGYIYTHKIVNALFYLNPSMVGVSSDFYPITVIIKEKDAIKKGWVTGGISENLRNQTPIKCWHKLISHIRVANNFRTNISILTEHSESPYLIIPDDFLPNISWDDSFFLRRAEINYLISCKAQNR